MIECIIKKTEKKGSSTDEKYYVKVLHTQVVDFDELAAQITSETSLKKSDVLRVYIELCEHIVSHLREGHIVALDELGRFKLEVESTGVKSIDETGLRQLKGVHCCFLPTVLGSSNKMLDKLKFEVNSSCSNMI
jgi:predicted histone-like DNA-binding protein